MDAIDELDRIKELEDARKTKAQLLDDAFINVLSTTKGRAVMWHLIGVAGIYRSTIEPNKNIFFLEGRRSIGLEILNKIEKLEPEFLVKMMLEANQARLNDKINKQNKENQR